MPYDRRFFKYLLFPLLCLTVWINSSSANVLKDIRVGEYENFTRIVFELDADTETALRVTPDSDQLRVDFPATQPDLTRKIPIERAERIEDIQIWNNDKELSAIVKLTAPQVHVEWFTLRNPPRFAVDIIWKQPTSEIQAAIEPVNEADATGPIALPDQRYPESSGTAPSGARQDPEGTNTAPEKTTTPNVAAPASVPPKGKSAPDSMPEQSNSMPTEADRATPSPATTAAGVDIPKRSNWLQYYLVVALIVITISILFLLILMLLTRYRWINGNVTISPKEHLQKQNGRIAELDERIKDNLKRYDEA